MADVTASEEPRLDLSVVIPVYNEEESLPHLYERCKASLEALGKTYEIIFVDDGSADRSVDILTEMAEKDDKVVVIIFRRNYGQTAAIDAGFKQARGDVLVPMDADLQNDPDDIGALLEKLDEGYDVVSGWRKDRHDTFLTRKLPSRIANGLISKITGVKLHDYGCTLKAYRREVMKDVHLYGEMHRFIPVYARWQGAKITEMVVNHHAREFGTSKYNLSRTFRVVLDLITVKFLVDYTAKPLYFFGKFALWSWLLAFGLFVWVTVDKFVSDVWVHKNPLFLIGIFLGLIGMQILLIGVLAEVVVRSYYESQRRSAYTIRTVLSRRGEGTGATSDTGEDA